VSDGDNTFPFFDDFNGISLNNSKWSTSRGVQLNNGFCQLDVSDEGTGVNGVEDLIFASSYTVPINSNIEYRTIPLAAPTIARGGIADSETFFHEVNKNYLGVQLWKDGNLYCEANNNGLSRYQTNSGPYTASPQIITISWMTGSAKIFRNSILLTEFTSGVPTATSSMHPLIRDKQTVDWIFVRTCASLEPNHLDWSSEEMAMIAPTAN
jgi:hypothetical protein